MSSANPTGRADALRQATILAILVVVVVGLHTFENPVLPGQIDPTAMLALGFIVLASYTVGSLVGVIKLPHITGYLLAGLFFGPSFARKLLAWFPDIPAPFDHGVLNPQVIAQLEILDTLAMALIAMTAGGELRIKELRESARGMMGLIVGQFVAVMLFVMGLIVGVGRAFPDLMMPGIDVAGPAFVAIAFLIATTTLTNSPAVTIAVITETQAKGPVTRTILSGVILFDVLVVVLFGVSSSLAADQLGVAAVEGNLVAILARDIGGSILAGVVLGAIMAVYLRYVAQEVLIFVVGAVYTATFVGNNIGGGFHNHELLMFLAAGFTVSNFSRHGEALIRSVERLSVPVYVVFFTLAGAKLHLQELEQVWHFALALVVVRALGKLVGTRVGTTLSGASDEVRRFAWMGFISQAGIAITLASVVGSSLGEIGRTLETLIIAAVAINEMVGPISLKFALDFAGEAGKGADEAEAPPPPMFAFPEDELGPAPSTSDPSLASSVASAVAVGEASAKVVEGLGKISHWPEASEESWASDPSGRDLWGPPVETLSPALNHGLASLESDLQSLVRSVSVGPLRDFRGDAELYLRELRREFLRHHRRLAVNARSGASPSEISVMLRAEESKLAERWRGIVLGRGARIGQSTWTPQAVVEALDEIVEAVTDEVEAPWEEISFQDPPGEKLGRRLRRVGLRARRDWYRLFGSPLPPRHVDLRALCRFHLSAQGASRLEALAALFVQADLHLVARTRSIFEGIVRGYDAIAEQATDETVDLHQQLIDLRKGVEEELTLALDEVRRIARDGTKRTATALASGLGEVKVESRIYDTLDLTPRRRRTSRVFAQRMKALETLTDRFVTLRSTGAAEYNLLALELEIVGLEARIKETFEDFASRMEKEVQRRAFQQAIRVEEALGEAIQAVEGEITAGRTGDEVAAALRQITSATEKVAADATRVVQQLQVELFDDAKVTPVIEALNDSAASVTVHYLVPDGTIARSEMALPPPVRIIEVPFRETVITRVETHVGPRLLHATREIATKVRPLHLTLSDVERSLAFHVELAAAELEVVHDEPVPPEIGALLREMVVGQLERSQGTVSALLEQARGWSSELGATLRSSVFDALDELRAEIVGGELTAARVGELRRSRTRERAKRIFTELPTTVSEGSQQAWRTLRAMAGEDRFEAWRELLGLPEPRASFRLAPDVFAAPAPSTDIPMVYRRFFAPDAMEAADVLTGREVEIEHARSVLTSRADGRLRSVAIVGLDGVGKSSVARAVVRGGRWKSVRRMHFTQPVGVDAVTALFDDRQEGQLVVIDGLHWLVSAKPGGFAPLRRFVEGVIADGGKHAWLVHADLLFWQYACNVAPLADAFPEVARLEPLSAVELTEAIMQRHRLSEYEHAFDRAAGSSAISQLLARGASSIRRPAVQYFEELHAATGGLVRDALRLWLASITSIEHGQIIHVGPVPPSGFQALRRLPEDVLLILYQISRQGWMSPEVQAHLWRTDEGTALAQLTRLRHVGLLKEDNGTFRIAIHLRGAVVRVLQERGWLQ